MARASHYSPIGDYGLIGDCHSAALVSALGSIDWCCLPRFDSGSAFGRLLDYERGGYCQIVPVDRDGVQWAREYLPNSLVLQSTFTCRSGELTLTDCFVARDGADEPWQREIVRVVECRRGSVEIDITVAPRFDYGAVRPWIRRHGHRLHSAIGGNDALLIFCEHELEETEEHELFGRVTLVPEDRLHLALRYSPPELVGPDPEQPEPDALDRDVKATVRWWRRWSKTLLPQAVDEEGVRRSAFTLKAMTYAPTGAIAAGVTTSLPEVIGGERNFDYRYAWVRDSSFSSRAFAELGCEAEADAFRAFIMRSAAGHAGDLQVLYGVGGERRVAQMQEAELEGYKRSQPVRIGNGAAAQRQLDAYGELVNLTWRWHRRGHSPDDDDWRFIVSLINHAVERWQLPDFGIWEWPGKPEHFVHSKVLCWSAIDRGIRLAEECMRQAPLRRWRKARDEVKRAIERHGYDRRRGVYVQSFGRKSMDGALLLLPTVEYVDWRDERMVRTVQAVREELDAGDGLLYRYKRKDGLPGQEGAFLCCSFWLVECLARQGELSEARAVLDRALRCANDLGLFSEEVDPRSDRLLGNFPQGITHLSHISAVVALSQAQEAP